MTYRIAQAHDGWRASFEGHGKSLSVTRMKNESEAVTNLNRLLVHHRLSRMQLPVRQSDDAEIVNVYTAAELRLLEAQRNAVNYNRNMEFWYGYSNSVLNTLYN